MRKKILLLDPKILFFSNLICFYNVGLSVWATNEHTYLSMPNAQKVNATYWRGSQPNGQDLSVLKNNGVKTLIDLRLPGPGTIWESDQAKKLGLNYFNLPMAFGRPSDAKVKHFLSLVCNPSYQPVFVHCRQGADRTGALTAIYRLLVDGWTFDEAYWEMRLHHFKPALIQLKDMVKSYGQAISQNSPS